LTIGATSAAPLTSGTISGTSIVYFIADGATVTLPAASTSGQELILLDTNVNGSGFTLNAAGTNTIEDGPASASGASAGIPTNCIMISDGGGKWWVVQRQ
jgi:hypothetical protein